MARDLAVTAPEPTPRPDQSTPARELSRRPQVVLLQSLVSIVLSYQILYSPVGLIDPEVQHILILGLLSLVAGAMILPVRLVESRSFTIVLLLVDTTVTSAVIYISGDVGSDMYLAYFLIILISASARTLKQKIAFSVVIAAAYGGILYLGVLQTGVLTEGQLMRVTILLVMGLFYAVVNETLQQTLQDERHQKTALIDYIDEREQAQKEKAELEERLRLSQKLETVGQLAGGIAHDFNNLLTAINGHSDMLLSDLGPKDPSRHGLEQIAYAGERAASLTRQLLAFSRKQVLAPQVLDLNDMVGHMETLLRRLIGEDIRLVTHQEPTLWSVKADPGQLEQVILNLAINARDAMPKGGQVTIVTQNVELGEAFARAHVPAQPGSYVLLTVSDNGSGMDLDTQARIFEPFFTTKKQGKGTGLGLPTVYGIVKQSGGCIDVDSELGKGTTFKIYLPRVAEQPEYVPSNTSQSEVLHGSETILLVEDEEVVRNVARHALELHRYTVLGAENGKAALRLAEAHRGPIDLLLTDIVMPGMSGWEVAERLVAARPETKVLYMSGYTSVTTVPFLKSIVQQGVLEPGTAFLQKPFKAVALARKVREALDRPAVGDSHPSAAAS